MVSVLSEATEGLGTSGNQDIIEKRGLSAMRFAVCLCLFVEKDEHIEQQHSDNNINGKCLLLSSTEGLFCLSFFFTVSHQLFLRCGVSFFFFIPDSR